MVDRTKAHKSNGREPGANRLRPNGDGAALTPNLDDAGVKAFSSLLGIPRLPPLDAGDNDGGSEGEPLCWSYSVANGWARVPDPIPGPAAKVMSEAEVEAMREAAGYFRMATFGPRHGLVQLDLFRHSDGSFLAEVSIGDEIFTMRIFDEPSMIGFLKLAGPVVEMGRQAEND